MALRSMILVATSPVAFGHRTAMANQCSNTSIFVDPISIGSYDGAPPLTSFLNFADRSRLSESFSLQKNIHPMESPRVQLRAGTLKAFNRTLWGNIDTNAASPLLGQVTGASDWFSPRKIQLGVRADR